MSGRELDEEVTLSDYNPAWPGTASKLACHLGSTAVPGLEAKPVIDLLVGVQNQEEVDEAAKRLAADGWQDLGEAGVAGRRHLRLRKSEACNLHLVLADGVHWANNLALRDYLRSHPDEAYEYAVAKRNALKLGHTRLLAYSAAKSDMISALLSRAMAWSRQRQ